MMLCGVMLLATLWLDIGADSNASTFKLESRWTEKPPVGASVRYRLARGYADGSWTNDSYQTCSDFAVDLTKGIPAYFYRVDAEVTVDDRTVICEGTNTIGLIYLPLMADPDAWRIPIFFEQPGIETGRGMTIDLMLKCNRFVGDERFWVLDELGRPRYGWRVDGHGNFVQFPRYEIDGAKCERKDYEPIETIMSQGWMLKPEAAGAAVKGYWLCGQYRPLDDLDSWSFSGSIAHSAKNPNSWNPANRLYFFVPYLEGQAAEGISLPGELSLNYLLLDGQTGVVHKAKGGKWPVADLPPVPDLGKPWDRGLPFGTVYWAAVNTGLSFVRYMKYGWTVRPEYVWKPRVCVATAGPDYYDDGELVRDGEGYAVVKAPAATERIAFTEDGRLVDSAQTLVAVLPAKGGRLPETVLEFDPGLADGEVAGDYFVCLLDTRIDAQTLSPRRGALQMPTVINACTAPSQAGGGLPSFPVAATANFATCEYPKIGLPSAAPIAEAQPEIGMFQVTESNILLTVNGMDPDRDYFVVPAKTIDAFEAPLPDRPIGNVFNLRKQDEHRFFKVICQPKAR